jgi:hypothetical protein
MTRATMRGRDEAYREALGALADSRYALTKAADLVKPAEWRRTLGKLAEEREQAERAMIDRGITAGLDSPDPDTHTAEGFRRAWMALESKVRSDAAVIETLRDEEHTAVNRLTSILGKGLPSTVENEVKSSIATIEDDLERLDDLSTT